MTFKIVFLGTPDFAIPSLKMLLDSGYDVRAVITQPDRKAGRGQKMMPPPVKVFAQQNDIDVYQFEKISTPQGVAKLKELAPDLLITAAYGHILTQEILDIPKLGCINVHASLLPKLRGAAPIQWAIVSGEKQTGVTTMYTVLALDAGDILESEAVEIPQEMTAGQLYEQLSEVGARVLQKTLQKLGDGSLVRVPQDEKSATYFPMFKKGFGKINFEENCQNIINFVRGLNPMPCAYIVYQEEKIKIYKVTCKPHDGQEKAGTVLCADAKSGLEIVAKDGVIVVEELQRQGAKRMNAKESLRGKRIEVGYQFQ
ncbi:MAG: methionyl-tRNA formyltransferase [Christensenellaceae bacterium]